MKNISGGLGLFGMIFWFFGIALSAQQAQPTAPETPSVSGSASPVVSAARLMKVSGVLNDAAGQPLTGVTGLTLSLYKDQQGGNPLWMETQNVQPDGQGNYTVLLGSTLSQGMPVELFTSGESRWLGVQAQLPGAEEQPRVLLVTVPYALKAADADTVGGMPASAFLLAPPDGQSLGDSTQSSSSISSGQRIINRIKDAVISPGTGTTNALTKWLNSSGTLSLTDSAVFELGGNVGIGTTVPGSKLDIYGGATQFNLLNATFKGTGASDQQVFNISVKESGGPTESGYMQILANGSPQVVFSAHMGDVNFITSGNVGIGTTAPASLLSVGSSSQFQVNSSGNVSVGTTFSSVGVATNIIAKGADPTGVLNSAPAIAAAIANSTEGGTVLIPLGQFMLNGTGTELILINKSIHLVCDSWQGTRLLINPAVPSTTDVIRVTGTGGDSVTGFTIDNCNIAAQSGLPAKNAINLDATSGGIFNFVISHNYLGIFGGNGIITTFPSGSDGVFNGVIRENSIHGGVNLTNGGDDLKILHNSIAGVGPGITVNSVGGATTNIIEGNSITACSGGIVVNHAENLQILSNIIEPAAGCAAETNSALIDILGSAGTPVKAPRIVGNQLTPLAWGSTNNTYGVRLDYATDAVIEQNKLDISLSTQTLATTTTHAVDTVFGVQSLNDNGCSCSPHPNYTNLLTDGSATTLIVTKVGNNLGIGTTNPAYKLDIYGDASNFQLVEGTYKGVGASDQSVFAVTAAETGGPTESGQLRVRSNGADSIILSAEPGANSYINNGGNVGINTPTPAQALEVVGNVKISGPTTNGLTFADGTTQKTAAAAPNLAFSAVTAGANTAALTVGSGGTLSSSGGTITANALSAGTYFGVNVGGNAATANTAAALSSTTSNTIGTGGTLGTTGSGAITATSLGGSFGIPVGNTVAATLTTTSSTYDAPTGGGTAPSVVVTIGSSQTALVTLTALLTGGAGNGPCYMSFSATGVSVSDAQSLNLFGNGTQGQMSATYLVSGLATGSNRFTVQYRDTASTCGFSNSSIIVTPY